MLPTSALIILAFACLAGLLALLLAWRLRRTHRQAEERLAGLVEARVQREQALRLEAAAAERERIYADLHDDLGAKLLGLIHHAKDAVQADLARAILQDLRDVVTRSRGTPGNLSDVLGDIRAEATQRLAAVGIRMVWEEPDDLPDLPLDNERALHLHRIVREAISNTIRHAHAGRLRVRLRADNSQLRLELTDDGVGVESEPARPGLGMRSMRERAAELAGDIRWTPGTEGGAKVSLAIPLRWQAPNPPETQKAGIA
jgi:signal transduction histidine kinase